MFAREGYPFIIGAAVLAALTFAVALRLRSWPLWLAAFLLTVVALWVAWFFRSPDRPGARGGDLVIAPADGRVVHRTPSDAPALAHGPTIRVAVGQRTRAGMTVIAHLSAT